MKYSSCSVFYSTYAHTGFNPLERAKRAKRNRAAEAELGWRN
jgi:hypothetical protein